MENEEKLAPQEEILEEQSTEETPAEECKVEKVDVVKGIEELEAMLTDSQKKVESLEGELAEGKDQLLRTLAEYDNFRRRTAKEKTESYNNGVAGAVSAIIPVIDTLEMALSAPCADENFKKGVEMTLTMAQSRLKGLGVEEIDALGKEFDPKLHSAVMQESVEGTEPSIVVNQLQKGYTLGDRVIRHAAVSVSC